MEYVILIIGFVLLIKGADYFVDGASSVAKLLKIPSVIIGLTVVAMGTSAPEAAVSISAGFSGNSDIALSNVVGSNIFNLLIVVGVSAMICPIVTEKVILTRDIWWSLGAAGVLLVMMLDMQISTIEGILLLCGMVTYIALLIRSAKKNRIEGEDIKTMSPIKSILCIAGGIALQILARHGIRVAAHIDSVGDVQDDRFDPLTVSAADFAFLSQTPTISKLSARFFSAGI